MLGFMSLSLCLFLKIMTIPRCKSCKTSWIPLCRSWSKSNNSCKLMRVVSEMERHHSGQWCTWSNEIRFSIGNALCSTGDFSFASASLYVFWIIKWYWISVRAWLGCCNLHYVSMYVWVNIKIKFTTLRTLGNINSSEPCRAYFKANRFRVTL